MSQDRFTIFWHILGLVDTGGQLIPVVLPDLRISLRKKRKIQNYPTVIFRGLGKMIDEKNLKQKIS
jgi:hypothetical protein